MDEVFKALADPSRRQLLDRLNQDNGQTLRQLCGGLGMARQSVTKHLAILEAANLITTTRRGREKLHFLNVVPINDIAERWISRYDRNRVQALADMKSALEDIPMPDPEFRYTTYVRTTPKQLWQALTKPAFTLRYWGVEFESDWQVGSTIAWRLPGSDVLIADPDQVILESDPYRILAYTWHTFSREWAANYGVAEEVRARFAAETRSRASFHLQPEGDVVKLTVVHEGFEPGSAVLDSVSTGWPAILASLKSLLETDRPLTEQS